MSTTITKPTTPSMKKPHVRSERPTAPKATSLADSGNWASRQENENEECEPEGQQHSHRHAGQHQRAARTRGDNLLQFVLTAVERHVLRESGGRDVLRYPIIGWHHRESSSSG